MSDSDDTIYVTSISAVHAGAGNDLVILQAISSGYPDVVIDGGSGYDVLDATWVSTGSTTFFFDAAVGGSHGFTIGDFAATGFEEIYGNAQRQNYFTLQDLGHSVTIHGGSASDRITGSFPFADVLYGYGGDDYINIRPHDQAYGGDGDDTFALYGSSVDLSGSLANGGSGSDTLELFFGWKVDLSLGTADSPFSGESDVYEIRSVENVEVAAWSGYATSVVGNEVANRMSVDVNYDDGSVGVDFAGRGGVDTLTGSIGNDTIDGGDDNDYIDGRDGDDWFRGGAGEDRLLGHLGNDTMDGGDGADYLDGADGNDQFQGGNGNDVIFGREGSDLAQGGTGFDTLYGQLGNDTLNGGDDADTVSGAAGADQVYGDAGDDWVFGGADSDTLFGGMDNDIVSGGGGNDVVWGDEGDDVGFGGGNEDDLYGGIGNDLMSGGTGHDTLLGGDGYDMMFGAAGDDSTDGGAGGDVLGGGHGSDTILGGEGNDTITGSIGVDIITGGSGNDLLSGGSDADTFIFALGFGNDTLAGFQDDQDELRFRDDLWGGGKTVEQVLADHATQLSRGVIEFNFGDVDSVRVSHSGGITLSDLLDDLIIDSVLV